MKINNTDEKKGLFLVTNSDGERLLERNGKPLQCGMRSGVLVPIKSALGEPSFGVQQPLCSSDCALFSVHKRILCLDDKDMPTRFDYWVTLCSRTQYLLNDGKDIDINSTEPIQIFSDIA